MSDLFRYSHLPDKRILPAFQKHVEDKPPALYLFSTPLPPFTKDFFCILSSIEKYEKQTLLPLIRTPSRLLQIWDRTFIRPVRVSSLFKKKRKGVKAPRGSTTHMTLVISIHFLCDGGWGSTEENSIFQRPSNLPLYRYLQCSRAPRPDKIRSGRRV